VNVYCLFHKLKYFCKFGHVFKSNALFLWLTKSAFLLCVHFGQTWLLLEYRLFNGQVTLVYKMFWHWVYFFIYDLSLHCQNF